jgi:hypothetical protein
MNGICGKRDDTDGCHFAPKPMRLFRGGTVATYLVEDSDNVKEEIATLFAQELTHALEGFVVFISHVTGSLMAELQRP